MLEITPDDIASLNDEDLRSLVGKLCEAELRAHNQLTSAATWGGNQNAADGGIDVRVASQSPAGGFLPRPNVGFQVKKTDFSPALIGPEMRPSGELRPSIRALIQQGGAYIIASSGANTSDSMLRDRVDAMRGAIKVEDSNNALHVDFYDSSRLATWVRNHPGLVLWVRGCVGRAVSGWKPYEAWAFSPDGVADVYLLDDKAKLHSGTSDDKGISVQDGITRLRDALRNPRGVVRLAGLSGVGKTRLVQALFDTRIGEASLEPALVVYTDMNDHPNPQPSGMIHDLIAMRQRAIVVVDNCAPDLHRRLTEVCRTPESTVSVITVEYDVQEDEPEGTEVFRLEPSTPKLVEELLKRRFPTMSGVDANTIAEFSGGNSRVALALANTLERHETLSGLKDEELFKRLFHQRQAHDNSLLTAARVCALVYSFEGEALSGKDAELPILATVAGTTPQELFAKVAELKRRDLVQRRGVWRAVLPHAIANRLAVLALKSIPLESIEAAFTTERLMRSFSRRIGYLHESAEAIRVVEKWMGNGGLLENVAQLNELGVAMFGNVAPIAPAATLSALESALEGPNSDEIKNESMRRDRFASLLRSLAYDADHFDRAVAALLTLYDAEPRDRTSHPIEDLIVSLFHLVLSGTHATIQQRIRIVEAQLGSQDSGQRALGAKLLNALLETDHFSSWHPFEFGARPRDYGYWPKTNKEIEDWYLAVLAMAVPIAGSNSPAASSVQGELANAVRGLWYVSDAIRDRIEALSQSFLSKGYWQEGWIAVRTMLVYPRDSMSGELLTRTRAFEKSLRPKNIAEQVRAVVLTQAWGPLDFADTEEVDENESPTRPYERANVAAEELGKEVSKDGTLLDSLLPDLVRGNAGRLAMFGRGLALGAANKQEVWDKLTKALADTPEGERNVGTLAGFLQGSHSIDAEFTESVLDAALEHETLSVWFPVLQTSVGITISGVARLKKAVASGKAPEHAFRHLAWGRASDALSGADLKELVLAIAAKPDKGYAIATDILSMRLHSDDDKKVAHPPELVDAGRELLAKAEFEDRDNMHDYRLRMIANACLVGEDGEATARALCERFKAGLANYSVRPYHFDQLLDGLFKLQPRIALDVFFGGVAKPGEEVIEVDSFDDPADNRKNPLDGAPDDVVIAWCKEGGQERFTAIAQAVSFFRQGNDAPPVWTPLALKMLEAAPDPLVVLGIFIGRFEPRSWSGSRAAIIESRTRLLDELEKHSNPALAALAAKKRPELAETIAATRKWETERDSRRDERFE
jgi:hypothetical protein